MDFLSSFEYIRYNLGMKKKPLIKRFNYLHRSNLILLIAVVLICTILGGSIYASQVYKQESIEKQQKIKLEEDKKAAEAQAAQAKIQADKVKAQEETNKTIVPSQTPQSVQTKIPHYPLNDAELQERIQLFKNKGFSEEFINNHKEEIRWGKNIPIYRYSQDDLRYIDEQNQLDDINRKLDSLKSGY